MQKKKSKDVPLVSDSHAADAKNVFQQMEKEKTSNLKPSAAKRQKKMKKSSSPKGIDNEEIPQNITDNV